MEGDYQEQRWAMLFPCKEGVTPSDIYRQLSAGCGQKAPAPSAVFNWVRSWKSHRRLSVGGTETPLKNGSAKPFGSSQGDDSRIEPGRGVCLASSCLVFSLKLIILLQME